MGYGDCKGRMRHMTICREQGYDYQATIEVLK